MMIKRYFIILAIPMLITIGALPVSGETLWYNGDPDAGGRPTSHYDQIWPINVINYSSSGDGGNYLVYDDFVVSNTGMTINTVFAKVSLGYGNYQAFWEIRTGVVVGTGYFVENSGSIVASSGSVVPYGGDGPSYLVPGFVREANTLEITGLNISLEPGTYWLCIAPYIAGDASIFATMGANAIGQPQGNNGNSFYVNYSFNQISPTKSVLGPYDWDFSMGVAYNSVPPPVPLPSTLLFLGSGLLGLAGWRRFRKG